MDIRAKKLRIIEELLAVTNEELIDKLHALLKKEQQIEEDERVSIEQYNRELEDANRRIERGAFYTQEEVEKRSRSW